MVYLVILTLSTLRDLFELEPLALADAAIIGSTVLLWAVVVRRLWLSHVLDRLLGLPSGQEFFACSGNPRAIPLHNAPIDCSALCAHTDDVKCTTKNTKDTTVSPLFHPGS
ncbi:MAG: hypothetical protein HC837_09975 [Chloroflexaceae bacterium]|nr:hypothetical protein [Chloroflexaceae bacterium]